MLSLNIFYKALELKRALGVSLDEGSCFGVIDPEELRPSSLPEGDFLKEKVETKKKAKKKIMIALLFFLLSVLCFSGAFYVAIFNLLSFEQNVLWTTLLYVAGSICLTTAVVIAAKNF